MAFLKNFKKLKFAGIAKPLLFAFIIFGLIAPFSEAAASWWNPVSWVDSIGDAIMGAIAGILFSISISIVSLASQFLAWVIGPGFSTIGYTNEELVLPAWRVVRDLVNMGIILGLVAIGIGTALRTANFEAKTALPRLIAVALLINFTPVILGLIIDSTNILMNFFVENTSAGFQDFTHMLSTQVSAVYHTEGGLANQLSVLIILFVINLIASLIILLFAFLFMLRYIALWILIILSPLAFGAYIFPITRTIWNKWWSQFTQWCFIGVTGAFFLYLGHQMIALQTGPNKVTSHFDPGPSGQIALIAPVIPYILVIGFLIFGFVTALTTNAIGASAIGKMAKKGTSKLVTKAGKKGLSLGWKGFRAGSRAAAYGAFKGAGAGWKANAKKGDKVKSTLLGAMKGSAKSAFSPAEMRKAEQKQSELLEKFHIVPYGTSERKIEKERADASLGIKSMTDERIKEGLHRAAINPSAKIRQAEMLLEASRRDLLTGKGEDLMHDYARAFDSAEEMDIDVSEVFKHRVDAPRPQKPGESLSDEKRVEKNVAGQDPQELRRNATPTSFNSSTVINVMSIPQLLELLKNGSQKQKDEIIKTVENNPDLKKEISTKLNSLSGNEYKKAVEQLGLLVPEKADDLKKKEEEEKKKQKEFAERTAKAAEDTAKSAEKTARATEVNRAEEAHRASRGSAARRNRG